MTIEFSHHLEKENLRFDKEITEIAGEQRAALIIDSAEKISASLRKLSENHGRADFVLVISKSGEFPIKSLVIGEVANLERVQVWANLNANTLKAHPEAMSSDEIYSSGEGFGSIAVKDWIISVSGFTKPKMNTATAIGIAFGAHLISYQEAENLAHNPRINCVSEYMEHEGALTDPFFSHETISGDFELPHSHI